MSGEQRPGLREGLPGGSRAAGGGARRLQTRAHLPWHQSRDPELPRFASRAGVALTTCFPGRRVLRVGPLGLVSRGPVCWLGPWGPRGIKGILPVLGPGPWVPPADWQAREHQSCFLCTSTCGSERRPHECQQQHVGTKSPSLTSLFQVLHIDWR